MPSLGNGQCAYRWQNMGRCLDLAVTTRPLPQGDVTYDVPLCEYHALCFDQTKAR